MGGASENDDGMAVSERAGGGDVLVLRASGSDGYNSYFYNDLGVTSTGHHGGVPKRQRLKRGGSLGFGARGRSHLVCRRRPSRLPQPLARHALERRHQPRLATRNIAIGGTSAGMAILGGLRFTADNGTVYSDEAWTTCTTAT